jgi:RimJ/RimL family protein N-acetyltransferase
MGIDTPRLRLRPWTEDVRADFAIMNADPEVMADLGSPLSRQASDAKLDRYHAVFERLGFGRWVIKDDAGRFLGYAGAQPGPENHPLGPHFEIGWRLKRDAWGHGYATEAAKAALADAFQRGGLTEILAYTARDNLRSQAVMTRLGLKRAPRRDFTTLYGAMSWSGLVWAARAGGASADSPVTV